MSEAALDDIRARMEQLARGEAPKKRETLYDFVQRWRAWQREQEARDQADERVMVGGTI